jgi:hypothetical protein
LKVVAFPLARATKKAVPYLHYRCSNERTNETPFARQRSVHHRIGTDDLH